MPATPSHPPDELARTLAKIARNAGDLLLKFRQEGFSTAHKGDGSPVTEADLASEALILRELGATLPQYPVISEESAPTKPDKSLPRFLLVDPLDGTKGYLAGGDDYCVLIALIENGVPVAGAIDAPSRAKTWWAGETAYEAADRKLLMGKPISAMPRRSPLIATASLLHGAEESRALCHQLGAKDIVQENSALKFARLARGEVDIYPRPGRTMQWDIAAGHALLLAIGGDIRTLGGDAIRYGFAEDGWAMPPFIARRIAA